MDDGLLAHTLSAGTQAHYELAQKRNATRHFHIGRLRAAGLRTGVDEETQIGEPRESTGVGPEREGPSRRTS